MADNSPASMIRDLDDALAEAGFTATLRRGTATVEVRVKLNGPPAASQLTGQQAQQERSFVMSPTQINTAGWPGGDLSVKPDPRIPVKGDILITPRGPLTVQSADGEYPGDVLVRIDGKVKG